MNKLPTLSVKQLNIYLRLLLEGDANLRHLSVKGEVSNFVHHRSGHMYFTLKDSESSVKAVMFRQSAQHIDFEPKDGMTVVVTGGVSVFERDGQYQIYVDSMQPVGIGNEHLKLALLKEKLKAKGYFDAEKKKPLPLYPDRIGLITSPTGAAVKDVISVLARRYPQGEIFFYPCTVQGDGAATSVINAIEYFNDAGCVDVIIVTRGGGSSEDLSAFNDEELSTVVFNSNIPIVSAVGHEIDYTLLDFTADLRAPTPSAAAELVSPDNESLRDELYYLRNRITQTMGILIRTRRSELDLLAEKCDHYHFFSERMGQLNRLYLQVKSLIGYRVCFEKSRIGACSARLSALSPLNTLSRGYVAVSKDGVPVLSVSDLTEEDRLKLTFKDGKVNCYVEEVIE